MSRAPDSVAVSDFHQDPAGELKRMKGRRSPLVITQRGRAAAIMMSVEAYERGQHERLMLHRLALGEREIRARKGAGLRRVFQSFLNCHIGK